VYDEKKGIRMKEKLYGLLGIGFLGLLTWFSYKLIVFIFISLQSVDYKIIIGIVGVMATIISSVWIASYNARKAKEKVVYEAHREKKAEIYNGFMDTMITQLVKNMNDGKSGDELLPDNLLEFLYKFTAQVIIYGSPDVINAFDKFKNLPENNSPIILSIIDDLFREMRKDLGESNKNIEANTLMGLYIIGGKDAISKLPFDNKG